MPKAEIKALIIDYEPRGIKQLSEPLEDAGYSIRVAKDGISGLETFKREKPDLVVVEAMLPKRHGFEVCQEIKQTEHGRNTPVIVVTGVYKGRKYRSQAIHQHGADDYLEKPIPPEKLMETVERLLGPGRPDPVAATASSPAPVAPPAPTAEETPAERPVPPAARPPAAPAAPPVAASPDVGDADIVDRLNQIFGEPPDGGSAG